MCTALCLKVNDFYFGRNLDLEYDFGQEVVITPRNYPWQWRATEQINKPYYAMIGMANITDNYPLYAEAVNEHGLAMSSLNFPGNAVYQECQEGSLNLTPFEIIPYFLAHFKSVAESRESLEKLNLIAEKYNDKMPLTPLHFILADEHDCVVIEPVAEGIKIYENPYGVLTNNPPFPFQIANLELYANLSAQNTPNSFAANLQPKPFGQGIGAFGLPGDSSPPSRFVKTCFHKLNSVCEPDELSAVSQFFHILDAVSFVRGSVVTEAGLNDITTYSCAVNCRTGDYYFKTYDNHQICCVSLRKVDLDGSELNNYTLPKGEAVNHLN
ncbi:MAG: choloylglycine hydrolase [Eubacteriales bacterium]|nr:choloylglycine hydrolase [Eubacteriales bacterium]